MKYEVEFYNFVVGDTDYDKSKDFETYAAAVNYVLNNKSVKNCYAFIYFQEGDHQKREEWTGGKHNKWLDEEIY